ncbi:MAG: energy-coupling factor transporter ATPase [Ruminococcaceae bacterium]|nr:energy-coupling factor transporter ATPase [Oscillospiraceae bacterium]
MFDLKNVSFSYEETEREPEYEKRGKKINIDETLIPSKVFAVENLNFTIKKGEFVAIVGRNGSGKSTCAKLLNGLLLPENGTVIVDSFDTKNSEFIWEIRSRVGMVFQNPDNQIIGTTVEEDVAFGPENLGVPYFEMVERVNSAIETVGLSDHKSREPHLLSGGQKQRVAIAGILAMKPKCIVLDEATAMLDPIGRREVIKVITKLNKEHNITVVLITHHMDEVAKAQRAILIDKGKMVFDGTPGELFSHREEVYEAGLETPQVSQLFYLLNKEEGFNLPEDTIDVDTACARLEALLKGDNHVH